jgi:uncharacterized protein (DUF2132 family)
MMVAPDLDGVIKSDINRRSWLMNQQQKNNPLHGIKLQQIVKTLVEHYGWEELGERINIKCFNKDPSVKSSLKFLRKTPWAREKVENLYLFIQKNKNRT